MSGRKSRGRKIPIPIVTIPPSDDDGQENVIDSTTGPSRNKLRLPKSERLSTIDEGSASTNRVAAELNEMKPPDTAPSTPPVVLRKTTRGRKPKNQEPALAEPTSDDTKSISGGTGRSGGSVDSNRSGGSSRSGRTAATLSPFTPKTGVSKVIIRNARKTGSAKASATVTNGAPLEPYDFKKNMIPTPSPKKTKRRRTNDMSLLKPLEPFVELDEIERDAEEEKPLSKLLVVLKNVKVKNGNGTGDGMNPELDDNDILKDNGGEIMEDPDDGAGPSRPKRGRSSKTRAQNKIAESAVASIEDEKKDKQDNKKTTAKKPKAMPKRAFKRQRIRPSAPTRELLENGDDDDDDDDCQVMSETKPKTVVASKVLKKTEKVAKNIKMNPTTTQYADIDFNIEKNFNFKITSWNTAGLRAWLLKGGLDFFTYENPDIVCLQETKCAETMIPDQARISGYHLYWLCKPGGHNGVAIYTKKMPLNVDYGIGNEELDEESRIMTAEYEKFYLVCVYVPNSGRKLVTLPKRLNWNNVFNNYVSNLNMKKPVIIGGDLNVAHTEIDLSNPKTNKKNAGFTPEERDGMTKLLSLGFVDTYRYLYPDTEKAYTFWSYMGNARSKNIGWRLDYFLVSETLALKVVDNVMRSEVLGSDHCPITLFLNI